MVNPERERHVADSRVKLKISSSIAAFVLFLAINVVWAQSRFGLLSPGDFPHQTWTGTAVDDFLRTSKDRAQLMFLGSSLMDNPLVEADADFLRERVDAPYYHHSAFFEDQYKKMTGRKLTTYNFAIPGEMPSDAYLISKFLLKGERRPDVIVYGVGPRDFLDNLLPSASATDPFKNLSRLGDVSDHLHMYLGDEQQQFDRVLGQLVFTYGHKDDLSANFNRVASAAWLPHLFAETSAQEGEIKQMVIPEYGQFQVQPGVCLVAPTKPGERLFKDNLDEYRDRYRDLIWDTFLTQVNFLGETMDVANARGIGTVLVAMPITSGNRKLISPFVWNLYKMNLRAMAKFKGATFIDMDKCAAFSDDDFADTVHLNAKGAARFLKILAEKMVSEQAVATALRPRLFDDESVRMPQASLASTSREAGL